MRLSLPPGRKCGAVVLIATLVMATRLVAQSNTGNVYGNVIDEQGSPVPGGTATLTGAAAPRTASVDARGFFRFLRVAPGKYRIAVAIPGFATVTRENVLVLVGQNTQVDVPIRLATVQESVTVTSARPLVDARKVETGQTFTRDELTAIPTARDVWSLIAQIPGVQIDTVNVAGNQSAQIGGPSLMSKGSGNVTYEVDGATVTDNKYGHPLQRQNGGTNMFFDFSTFENVEVATGGSILEQQTSGVTINVVTKRGTNELKGYARYLYASANWQSSNTPQEAVDEGLQTNSTRYIREYGAELGGPIVADRVWLWAAASSQDISVHNVHPEGDYDYPQTTFLEPWSAKLNAQISNANSAALYFQSSNRLQYGVFAGPDRPPPTRQNYSIPTEFYKAEDSNVFSADLFGSAFGSYQSSDFAFTPVGGLDKDIQFYDNSQHQTAQYFNSKAPQKQANLQVSKFFNTGRINHELKFSFNYRQQIGNSVSGAPGDQNAGQEASGGSPAVAFISRGVHRVSQTQYWSGTLGDTLTTGNLTLAAGVRYDLQQAKNLPGTSFGNTVFPDLLPEVRYHGASGWQFQYTNWQPRVSATYALGENKSTLLRASYARFADQLGNLAYYLSGTPILNGYVYYWNDLNGDHNVQRGELVGDPIDYLYGVDPAVLPGVANQIQPGFRTPTTNEFTAGVDRQLTEDFALSATFSYRSTDHLQSSIPIGSSPATWALGGHAAGTATAPNGFTINFDEPFYLLTLPDRPSGVELTNRPGATQRYYGVDVSAVKRLSQNWTLRANFGWNSFRQYLTPQSIQNPNNFWNSFESGTGQNDNGGLVVGTASWGNVFINASWQFNVSGLYQGPWGLAAGANFFGRQGYANPYWVGAGPGTLEGGGLLLIDRVDTYRFPNVYELDLRVQKTLAIGPVTLIPTVEIFNVANGNSVLQRFQGVGGYNQGTFNQDPNFNQITEVQSPRIVRLGLQLNF